MLTIVCRTLAYPDDLEEPVENEESEQFALLIRKRKCYDGRKKLEMHSLVVQSKLLKNVLGKVLEGYPGISTNLERVEFFPPFQPFVHRWERFAEAREKETDPETRAHVDLLWAVLEEELRNDIAEKNDHIRHGVVSFNRIWTIFEPGVLVYGRDNGHDRVYRLSNGNFSETQCGRFYTLNAAYVDWDGERFGQGIEQLSIREFSGTQDITKLKAFPFSFHPEREAIEEKLLARGKVFESYRGYQFKQYDGIAQGMSPWGLMKHNINSRVIVDTYAFNRFNPNQKNLLSKLTKGVSCTPCDSDDYDSEEDYESESDLSVVKHDVPPLTREQLLIATHELRGYALKEKKWLYLSIDNIGDIVWNDDAFKSLVAPPEQKELILAFARSQTKNKGRGFDDVIQGKGRGIIMMLQGPPGVGKTLTAESVAETMKVPLYSMSAGDLGTQPSEVEASLSNILEMNTKWNAVLLLDEADVFLEARSAHDLERNKLVSIFLRLLEYYEGILFLTTNRIENIDAAFESRIHLSLQYDNLDKTSRAHVWRTFVSRATGAFSDKQIDALSEYTLNGRQIKNIIKTSQLLADEQGKKLSFEHVEVVLKIRAANTPM
jgi:hypothetical protein